MNTFESTYQHYTDTGDFAPLLALAPKDPAWGQTTPPFAPQLLPTGQALLDLLFKAVEQGQALGPSLYWANWSTLPR